MLSLDEVLGISELGLVYSLVAVGIFLSFRVLNFSDLTVDGSFGLGSAVFVSAMQVGFGLELSLLLSFLSGAVVGLFTAFLSIRLKFGDLLGSILILYALYSVNFRIVGASNLVIDPELIRFSSPRLYLIFTLVSLILLLLFKLLNSEFGLSLRAVGINENLVRQFGLPLRLLKILGLSLSNALIAMAGGLFSVVSGFYDISVGTGTLIAGLTSLIIGETFSKKMGLTLLFCVLGSFLYRLAIHIGFNSGSFGLVATDLNLISTVVIVVFVLGQRTGGVKISRVFYARS